MVGAAVFRLLCFPYATLPDGQSDPTFRPQSLTSATLGIAREALPPSIRAFNSLKISCTFYLSVIKAQILFHSQLAQSQPLELSQKRLFTSMVVVVIIRL